MLRRRSSDTSSDAVIGSPLPKRPRLHLSSPPPPTASSPPPSSPSFFDSLPEDILLSIFSFLSSSASSPSHLINAMLACKRFCAAGNLPQVLSRLPKFALAVKASAWSDAAKRFLQRCADAGNAEAAYILGMIQFYCLKERPPGASLMAQAALKSQHAEALYSLAIIQFNGSVCKIKKEKNLKYGAVLCAKAAGRGHIAAMRELGHCLQDGYGVKKNEEDGRKLLSKANAREAANAEKFRGRMEKIGALARKKLEEAARKKLEKLVKRNNETTAVEDKDTVIGIPAAMVGMQVMAMQRQLQIHQGMVVASPPPLMLCQPVHPANRFMVEWFTAKPPQFTDSGESSAEPLALCAHAGCGRVEVRPHEFRRCSACGCANYCSRSCQSVDWSLRHKFLCPRRRPPAVRT